MTETIGIIASILGIIGAIWATIRFIFNPFFKRQEEYKNISRIVNESFDRWMDFKYSSRGGAMISHDNFLIVNKFKKKFKKQKAELKVYLLMNAIQNGLGGNWGFWLYVNKNNGKILLPLFISLNKSSGLRPQWRSAYILEKIYQDNTDKIDSFLFEQKDFSIKDSSILDTIRNKKVQSEMIKKKKKGTKEEKEKIPFVLDEIERFTKEINAFTLEQSINK